LFDYGKCIEVDCALKDQPVVNNNLINGMDCYRFSAKGKVHSPINEHQFTIAHVPVYLAPEIG
jgi:hypothetical protein